MTSGKPVRTKVTVNGVDVSSALVGWKFTKDSSKSLQNIEVGFKKSVYDLVPELETSPRALPVIIQRGVNSSTEDYVFRGEIIERTTLGSRVSINCSDELYKAVKKNITKTFDINVDTEAGVISEIFKTLLDTANLSYDSSSITNSGTTLVVRTFICNHADVFERLEFLASLLDWQFFYNPEDDLVYFQPKGTRAGTNTLKVGVNVTNRPKWLRSGKGVASKVTLFGGPVEPQTTEYFDGDNMETEFTLAKVPLITKVVVDGSLLTGAVEDQAGADADYYIDNPNKKITFVSAPSSGTNNIQIDYTYSSPIVLQGENPAVSNGGETTLRVPDLTTVHDAQQYLDNYQTENSKDTITTKLDVTNVTDLYPGQTVTVIDGNEGVNETFIITKVEKSFPYRSDVVTITNKPLQQESFVISTDDRLRRIEERLVQESDLVIFIKTFTGNRIFKFGRRYMKAQKRTIETSFILGHPDNGVLGTSTMGDFRTALALNKLVQGANLYLETFDDDDFSSGNTTATWGSSGSVTFTSGQIAESSSIDYDNGTITHAELTSTEESGSFTYELSADGGSNWEIATSGALHSFTNTGTDLRWRATENAASTGEISQVVIDRYH